MVSPRVTTNPTLYPNQRKIGLQLLFASVEVHQENMWEIRLQAYLILKWVLEWEVNLEALSQRIW